MTLVLSWPFMYKIKNVKLVHIVIFMHYMGSSLRVCLIKGEERDVKGKIKKKKGGRMDQFVCIERGNRGRNGKI